MASPALLPLDPAAPALPLAAPKPVDKARQAAEGFEAVFLSQVLDTVFAGIETDGPLGGGGPEKVFRSILNEQIAGKIARGRGTGVADAVYRELIKMQEARGLSPTLDPRGNR